MNKRGLVALIGMLSVALGATFVDRVHGSERYNWEPPSFPVALQSGATKSATFDVEFTGHYDIEFWVLERLPERDLECLLGGVQTQSGGCQAATRSKVALSWELHEGDKVVGFGDSDHRPSRGSSWSRDRMGVQIGRFHALEGHRYQLKTTSTTDAPDLVSSQPTIEVRPLPSTGYENAITDGQLLLLVGWGGLFGGGIMLLLLVVYMATS